MLCWLTLDEKGTYRNTVYLCWLHGCQKHNSLACNTKPCPLKCANCSTTSGGQVLITGSILEEDQEAEVLISLAASCFRRASEEGKQAFEKPRIQNIQPQITRGGEEISLSPFPPCRLLPTRLWETRGWSRRRVQ